MPKTTDEIKNLSMLEIRRDMRWYSEEEVKKIKAEAYELGVDDGYLERINEAEKEQLKEEGLL